MLDSSAVSGNTATDKGGGLYLSSGSTASVTDTDFADNDPQDSYHYGSRTSYDWGEDASFECTGGMGGCE